MHSHTDLQPKEEAEEITFGPFRLTPAPLRLWRGRREVKLPPRPLGVLRYLVEHAGAVVSRQELLHALWQGTIVTPAALQVCVRAVRAALGDEVEAPRYIATVGRQGYRFIQDVARRRSAGTSGEAESQRIALRSEPSAAQGPGSRTAPSAPFLAGRDAELAQLHSLLEKTLHGDRQLVFVTGEAGIGKTTLVDAFLAGIGGRVNLWLGRGQCLEHYGEGEAYLPVLEALGQVCQGPGGTDVLAALRRYAPTWLLHLPGVAAPEEREVLQRQGAGATQGQMLREMADALEAMSAVAGMVLVFEDLHVSDPSTVELLAYLAQRRAPARLLIIGTYRPVEVAVTDHPLRGRVQELLARGYGQRLALELLTQVEVDTYLRWRLATPTLPATLAGQIWQRTDGNALFMVSTVDYLLQQGWLRTEAGQWQLRGDITNSEIPETLEHLITKQLDDLRPDQQHVLEVASVVGTPFPSVSVAAGMQAAPQTIEEVCEGLAQRGQFIIDRGLAEWPDGTVSGLYGFRHALYQKVLYKRLGPGRRARLHLAIGMREETGYGVHAGEHAAELTRHFGQGRDLGRAVQYLSQAGQNALRRSAYVEAHNHFSHGLTLLLTQRETPERRRQELWLQVGLATALMATKGFAAPEVESALRRARALYQQTEEVPELFPVVLGLRAVAFTRGELGTARQVAEQLLRLAHDQPQAALRGVAHAGIQAILYHQGELAAARVHGEQALAHFAVSPPTPPVFNYGPDPEVPAWGYAAAVLHALGYADQARQQSRATLALAQDLVPVHTRVLILNFVATMHGAYGEWAQMQACAAELLALATAHTLPFWWAQGMCNQGIAQTQQGDPEAGISQIRQGLAVYRATGATLGITRILGWLAEAYGLAGQTEEGLQVLAEAFAVIEQNGERMWEAELYRRQGVLTLQPSGVRALRSGVLNTDQPSPRVQARAEGCFRQAIDIARRQQAKVWELRAAISLSRLWQSQGKQKDAHGFLSEIYGWFTEGFDAKDLQEARTLLQELT